MLHFLRSEKYSAIGENEDAEIFISERLSTESRRLNPKPRASVSLLPTAVLILASLLLACILGLYVGRRFPSNLGATRQVSKYSPISEEIDITYDSLQFNGSFVHENIYRQDAGPEVDAAWEALGVGFRPSIVPDSLAAKSGLTKDHTRRKTEYGGGYPVFVEGLHQLHCLNLLRKSLYYNYDHYHSLARGAFSDPDHVQRWHVSHCLDFLRQHLMCTMDIGVFGAVWVNSTAPHPFVDFNTRHICRNFEEIRAWAEQRQIPKDVPQDYLERPTAGDQVKVWDTAP